MPPPLFATLKKIEIFMPPSKSSCHPFFATAEVAYKNEGKNNGANRRGYEPLVILVTERLPTTSGHQPFVILTP